MLDQITQVRVADPLAEVKALEEERQRRLAEAREKRLVEKAALVARYEGKPVYNHGRTIHVAVLPHPTNQGEVVEVWLTERAVYSSQAEEKAVIRTVVAWVRAQADVNRIWRFAQGPTWVKVFHLAWVARGQTDLKENPQWTYIPGAWEEAISAKAGEITEEIRERRQAKAAERVEALTRLLMSPRSV